MAYTTINKSTAHFNTVTYSNAGDGAKAVTGVGFQPDFTWLKARGTAYHHQLFDAVRGATSGTLYSSTNNAVDTGYPLTSFDSDGFTTGAQSSNDGQNSASHVAWNWKANGSGSSNTDGDITSTVSVNTTAGFSIVKWTNSTSNATTVGHGLGVAPQVMITKTTSGTYNWHVYHHKLDTTPQGDYLILNDTSAKSTATNIWNDTAPTSTVFSTGNNGALVNNTIIAYCFAEKTGYSKFGSYQGNNNADGTFVYTGFKPSFIMMKSSSTGGSASYSWSMFDNKRTSYNGQKAHLEANTNDAEDTGDTGLIDVLSNGFKLRYSPNETNGNNTYIYMAFGQTMVGTNNIPATAR